MGTYAQWRRAADKGIIRRFTWVCGPETVLADEVVDTIIARLGPECHGARYFQGAAGPAETEIWSAAAEYPLPGRKDLIVVREAQNLRRWDNLVSLVEHSRELRHLNMVFVSSEEALTRVTCYSPEGEETKLAHHLAVLRDAAQGQLVVCSPPSEADLAAWVKARVPLADSLVAHLLTRCGGNLAAIRDVCVKLAALEPSSVSRETIDSLAVLDPGTDFADALIAGHKREALAALPEPHELGSTIGLLDSRLDMLLALHKATSDGMGAADMHQKLRLPAFVIAKYRRFAPAFTETSVRHRRAILAVADGAYRQGAREGVAEAIAALW